MLHKRGKTSLSAKKTRNQCHPEIFPYHYYKIFRVVQRSYAYQIGTVNYQVWEQELAEGKIDLSKVNIFWTTPDYPDYH